MGLLEPDARVLFAEAEALADPAQSRGHTVLDLGEDEYTVGRLHPMMDQELRLRRLRQEAADDGVGAILLDVVLGDGAHPDPASELAPVIEEVLDRRGGQLDVVAVVVGTDEDPQDLAAQVERLEAAGARVFRVLSEAVGYVSGRLLRREEDDAPAPSPGEGLLDVATLCMQDARAAADDGGALLAAEAAYTRALRTLREEDASWGLRGEAQARLVELAMLGK